MATEISAAPARISPIIEQVRTALRPAATRLARVSERCSSPIASAPSTPTAATSDGPAMPR